MFTHDFQDRLIEKLLHVPPLLEFLVGVDDQADRVFQILLILGLILSYAENLLKWLAPCEAPQLIGEFRICEHH